ncbi:TIGR04076 family protein [Chloroflexota bacterium]
MSATYDVVAKVISQKGTCAAEHKVGDQWVIGSKTPEGMCLSAFNAMFPSLRVLRFGGSFPWSSDPDVATAACPDAQNPVVFELRRIRK